MRNTATNRGAEIERYASVRTPVPVVPAASSFVSPGGSCERPWVLPAVLVLSVAAHSLVLVAATRLPCPAPVLASTAVPVSFDVLLAPPEEPVAPPPPSEPEPEVATAAAVFDRPRPRIRRPEPPPPPEEATDPEPAPVSEVLRSEVSTDGALREAAWDHPAGEEGGRLDGTPGGAGTGSVGPTADGAGEAGEPHGISRGELRRRLLDYMRSTLWGFVAARVEHYPLAARREHLEGVVMLRIRLARDGRLLHVRLSRSSGHATLDRAALASVQELRTMPAPPRTIPWDDQRELPLPVTYRLER